MMKLLAFAAVAMPVDWLHARAGLSAANSCPCRRSTATAEPPAPGREAVSLADLQWFALFQDERLQALIRTALQNNYDVRIAVARVLEAQAQLGVTRSFLLPTIDGNGRVVERSRLGRELYTRTVRGFPRRQHLCSWASPSYYEVDLWGRHAPRDRGRPR